MSFDNQSVLVTGAASGIGRAIAQAFASEGAAVLLCDRDEAGLEETLTLVNAVGGRGNSGDHRQLRARLAGAAGPTLLSCWTTRPLGAPYNPPLVILAPSIS